MDQDTLAGLADRHLAMQTHHLALAEHHDTQGNTEMAGLHRGMAVHSLHIAKGFGDLAASLGAQPAAPAEAAGASLAAPRATATPASPMSTAKQPMPSGTDRMAIGAATQLLKKGHITKRHHARIVKKAFGSLSGAGHYAGDVDQSDSLGTNAGM